MFGVGDSPKMCQARMKKTTCSEKASNCATLVFTRRKVAGRRTVVTVGLGMVVWLDRIF
uniref:Uncharacterized protein n=1 Tax=Anguilla anguilla TaxID=7936 RepID=A0A0E9T5X3_ANGAN